MEENKTNVVETPADAKEKEQDVKTTEDLSLELAKLKAEFQKMKNANDNLSRENAEAKRKLREKQTAEEQLAEEQLAEKQKQEQYIKDLENYKADAEAKHRYMIQGMDETMASEAAQAELNHDMSALSDIQKKFTEAQIKKAEASWIKSRPDVRSGGDVTETDKIEEAFWSEFRGLRPRNK